MKQQDLSTVSTEELKQREKTLKTSLGIFIGFTVVLLGALVFMFTRQNTSSAATGIVVLFLALIVLVIFNKKVLSGIQAEIKTREKGNK